MKGLIIPIREVGFDLEDIQIVELYWMRSESAITESDRKYGKMLKKISYSMLSSSEDAEECVSDTYFTAWNRMPSDRPTFLGAFLSRIVRGLSIDRYRRSKAAKRSGIEVAIDELEECIPSQISVERELESGALAGAINRFLAGLDKESRVIFVRRYYFTESISEIAKALGFSEGKVKTVLFRRRKELYSMLEKEELL